MAPDHNNKLQILRDELREIDDQLMRLISQRVTVIKKIGAIKLMHGLPIYDASRELENKERNRELTSDVAPAAFVDDLSDLLAKWSRHIQSVQA